MQDAMGILGLLGPRGEAALAVFEHLNWKVFGPALAGVGNGRTSLRAQTVRVYSTDKQSNSELFLKFLVLALLALMGWRQSRNNHAVLPCFFFWELSAKKKKHSWQSWRLYNPCSNYWLDRVWCELAHAALSVPLTVPLGTASEKPTRFLACLLGQPLTWAPSRITRFVGIFQSCSWASSGHGKISAVVLFWWTMASQPLPASWLLQLW